MIEKIFRQGGAHYARLHAYCHAVNSDGLIFWRPPVIDWLSGVMCGNGFLGQSVDTLFSSAYPNGEKNGFNGTITRTQVPKKP